MDFTIGTYKALMNTLLSQGISFLTFEEFVSDRTAKGTILRHDVDLLPGNSLNFARIQYEMGIKGSYFFRIVPESFDEKIIKEIYSLGHEIGYHYEDLGATAQRHRVVTTEKELAELAILSFKENLERLRQLVPVKTICMHGDPMSKWDSRLLWKYYDYHDFGIAGEPYFDIDFNNVMYLTDTGRRWDGDSFNIRDKAVGQRDLETKRLRDEETYQSPSVSQSLSPLVPSSLKPFPKFHTTFDIISAAKKGKLSDRIMMTFHPQRWTDKPVPWIKEMVWQNVKNVIKYHVVNIINR